MHVRSCSPTLYAAKHDKSPPSAVSHRPALYRRCAADVATVSQSSTAADCQPCQARSSMLPLQHTSALQSYRACSATTRVHSDSDVRHPALTLYITDEIARGSCAADWTIFQLCTPLSQSHRSFSKH